MNVEDQYPFKEALDALRSRGIFPTDLSSAELQQLGIEFHQQNFASARNNLAETLDAFKSQIDSMLNPVTVQRADRITPENPQGNVTTGYNETKARAEMKIIFRRAGYSPEPEDLDTIKDLSSDARINLVLRTNKQLAQGQGHWVQGQNAAILDQWPAQELFRAQGRVQPRNWLMRWRLAGAQTGDPIGKGWTITPNNRMIALKNHAIWNWIGSSALFSDALDVIWPPFAFNSGMWVRDIDHNETIQLGLMKAGDAAPQPTNVVTAVKAFTEKLSALAN